ncbi:MAG: M1 family metallopeptidase [Solirubrobacterales bacterium]
MVGPRLTRALLCVLFAGLTAAGIAAARGGSRDPFFPRSGNRGYDVSHYDARLSYQPSEGWLRATATIEATATQRLRRFSLDLEGLRVTAISVDGERADFGRGRGKLKVIPASALSPRRAFTVVVHYQGRPETVIDPDGSAEGWYRTADGAIAVGEPVGTAAWLPCDNALTDKASFDFHLTVPKRLKAVANGRLLSVERIGQRKTYAWSESEPMAPYLAVIDIGRGRLVRDQVAGLPSWTLVDPALVRRSRRALAQLPEILRFESRAFGPYPFDSVGSIVDVSSLEYALETQTRPIYGFPPDRTVVVHESAHQWFGDSVGLKRWPEIWLNEGFATWTEWYYAEHHGGRSALRTFRRLYRVPASKRKFWDPPSGHPGTAANLFATSTYVRGGMALEALRLKIGTKKMLKVLRRWATEHRYGSAGIREFIALAEQVSGGDLGHLFHRWLYKPGKP